VSTLRLTQILSHLISTFRSESWIERWFVRQRKTHSLSGFPGSRGKRVPSEDTESTGKVYEWRLPMLRASAEPSVPVSQSGCLFAILPWQTKNNFSSFTQVFRHDQALMAYPPPQLLSGQHGSCTGPVNSLDQSPIVQYFQESQEYASSQISEYSFDMLPVCDDSSSSGTSTETQAHTLDSCLDILDFFSPSFPTSAFSEFVSTMEQPTVLARDTPPIFSILGNGKIAADGSSPQRQRSQAQPNSPAEGAPSLESLRPTLQPCHSTVLQTNSGFPQPGLATGLDSIVSMEPLQPLSGNQLLASQLVSAGDSDRPSPVFFTARLDYLKVMVERAWSPILEILNENFSHNEEMSLYSVLTNEIQPKCLVADTGALDSEMEVAPEDICIQKSISSETGRRTLRGPKDKEDGDMNHGEN
jgi:hypothetical protein